MAHNADQASFQLHPQRVAIHTLGHNVGRRVRQNLDHARFGQDAGGGDEVAPELPLKDVQRAAM